MILWKYANGVPMVSGKGTFGTYWLKRLGVTDVVVKEASGFTQVNMEQVYTWDPDILFLDGPGLLNLKTADVLGNNVEGADFSTLNAVKNGRVYNTTLGMWNWFTPNPGTRRWCLRGWPAAPIRTRLPIIRWRIPSANITRRGTATT